MLCRKCKKEIPDSSIFCNLCGIKQVVEKKKRKQKSGNGMGTIFYNKDRVNPWVARAPGTKSEDGNYKRVFIGSFKSAKEAQLALEKARKTPISDLYNYTLEQVFEKWKEAHYQTIGPKGQYGYDGAYKFLLPIANQKIRLLRTDDFQNIINSNTKYSISQLQKINQLLNQLCRWAMQNDIVDRNYAEFVKLPRVAEKEKRVFTIDESDKIATMVSDKRLGETARIAMALLYTGMRIGELLKMRSEDVHIFEGYMVGGSKTQAGKRRKIPIHGKIKPYIVEWLKKDSAWLIPSEHDNPRSTDTVRKGFNSLMKKLGIEGVTPHSCRHTYISRAIAAGMQKEVLQAIVGHAGDESTERYIHVGIDQIIASGGLIG